MSVKDSESSRLESLISQSFSQADLGPTSAQEYDAFRPFFFLQSLDFLK